MEKINARVVRKSAGCLNFGANFNFQELSLVPDEKTAKKLEKTAKHPTHGWVCDDVLCRVG